ncbi:MAG TPA: hypothetical protein VF290_01865 [Pyrinomonadaceae bacterium]
MKSTKKSTPARGVPQPFKAGPARPLKPLVAQLKTCDCGQSGKQPVAPPAYNPKQAPKVAQTKSSPVSPPVYRPEQKRIAQLNTVAAAPLRRFVAQAKLGSVAQMLCELCGRKPHRNTCPRHKNNLKKKEEKAQAQHQQSGSYINLYCYDGAWANKRGITESQVAKFVATGQKIHGHCSSTSDKDKKRHANTTNDIAAFHSWYEQHKDDEGF